jgi:hypothetical protein
VSYASEWGGTLVAQGGFFSRSSESDRDEDESGFSGSVEVNRRSSRSLIRLWVGTGYDEGLYYRRARLGSTFLEGGAGITYRLTDLLDLAGFAGYRRDDFGETPILGDGGADSAAAVVERGGSDENIGVGTSLAYHPRRWVSVSLGYDFRERTSEVPEDEYVENRVTLVVTFGDTYRFGAVPPAPTLPDA